MSLPSSSVEAGVDIPQDVPIFLRKTYHMIDTCDPAIACWSEDGETFIVKDPIKFEKTIIPQFFKHSKFSSFVRQLNFYSFRKIKYVDTLRIDPKLEAETANYWRFRHEKFRRNMPEQLLEIKRMNGAHKNSASKDHSNNNSNNNNTSNSNNQQQPLPPVTSSSGAASTGNKEESSSTKIEVQSLKQRIEEMTKNIDELTQIVKKVSLKQEVQEKPVLEGEAAASAGSKRKKVEDTPCAQDLPPSPDDLLVPDGMLSMDIDEAPALAAASPAPASRETSSSSSVSTDNEFVEQLFSSFNDDEDNFLMELSDPQDGLLPATSEDDNRPDPELMQRLSDALRVLPRDVQVMIVDRLIAAITNMDSPFVKAVTSMAAAEVRGAERQTIVSDSQSAASAQSLSPQADVVKPSPSSADKSDSPAIDAPPMTAATMTALLRYFNSQVQQQQEEQQQGKSHKNVQQKAIPVIPVHA